MSDKPNPCRICGKPVLWRSGLSNRVHAVCRAREQATKRARPERATPAYKLVRPVSRHGVTTPRIDVAKGNHRDRKLLDLAHELHACMNCGRYVEHGCNPCHENGINAGKGQSIKGQDHRHFAGCNECHAFYDTGRRGMDPSGRFSASREDKREMFAQAHAKTMDAYFGRGWLKVSA